MFFQTFYLTKDEPEPLAPVSLSLESGGCRPVLSGLAYPVLGIEPSPCACHASAPSTQSQFQSDTFFSSHFITSELGFIFHQRVRVQWVETLSPNKAGHKGVSSHFWQGWRNFLQNGQRVQTLN